MALPDFTPTYLVPPPWRRLLAAVRKNVAASRVLDRDMLEVRPDARDDLILAARYYDARRVFLERTPAPKGLISKLKRQNARFYLLISFEATLFGLTCGLLTLRSVAYSFTDSTPISLAAIWALMGTLGVMIAAFRQLESPYAGLDRAVELGEIENFNRTLPNVVSMARYEEPTPSIVREIDNAAHSGPGSPVVPPGLTELVLSRDDSSLRAIRAQLRATRRADVGMTLVSFAAFILAVAFCFWLLATTDKVSQGMVGIGGSGLVGLFCFYSTGRARSSQIALALFESLVAQLTVGLAEAHEKGNEERRKLEHATWRSFRVELNQLYLLERKRGSSGDRPGRT